MGEGTGGRRASAISCGLHRLAEALGDRAHDRVDYAQPEDEPGLRVLVRDDGGSDLRGDDPTDAQKARQSSLMRPSHSDMRKYRSMCVLVSRHEAIFEGSEIEGALSSRRRYTQGAGSKDLLGVGAHHKALYLRRRRETGGMCSQKRSPADPPGKGRCSKSGCHITLRLTTTSL